MAEHSLADAYLADVREQFRKIKAQAEAAAAQVNDEAFFATLDAESNSIAVVMKHMGGNLVSRFADFLTSDGEKSDRDRDSEFVAEGESRDAIMAVWHRGWRRCLDTLDALTPGDLLRTVHIRGEPHVVVRALGRSLAHQAGHSGQVVLLAKHFAGARWKTLSIPRGGSRAFTDAMATRAGTAPGQRGGSGAV